MLGKLALLNIPARRRYALKMASRLIEPGQVRECHEELVVTCIFAGREQEQLHFRLELESLSYLANAAEPARQALHTLLGTAVLQTDAQGNVQRLVNEKALREQWHQAAALVPQAAAAPLHDWLATEGGLRTYLQHASPYAILFPGLFGEYALGQPGQARRTVPRFAAGYDLPLTTQRTLAPTDEYDVLRRFTVAGTLDEASFERKGFARWLRNAVDVYDLRVQLAAEVEETYDFERDGWLTRAEQFVTAEVAGCYCHTVARTLMELKS